MPKRTAHKRDQSKRKRKTTRRKSPRCKRCEAAIRVPAGWSHGAAVRKHYWAKHPEVMRGDR